MFLNSSFILFVCPKYIQLNYISVRTSLKCNTNWGRYLNGFIMRILECWLNSLFSNICWQMDLSSVSRSCTVALVLKIWHFERHFEEGKASQNPQLGAKGFFTAKRVRTCLRKRQREVPLEYPQWISQNKLYSWKVLAMIPVSFLSILPISELYIKKG